MVLVRFCARALLQQLYRRPFVEGTCPGGWAGGRAGARRWSGRRLTACPCTEPATDSSRLRDDSQSPPLSSRPERLPARPPAHPPAEARYLSEVGREAIARHRAALLAAADALDALLAPAQCPQLVQAIVQVRCGVGCGEAGLCMAACVRARMRLVGSWTCCTGFGSH